MFGESPLVGYSPAVARVLGDPDEERTGPLVLRAQDDEFWVDEVPLYPESGEGEHLYLHLRKRGISTPDLVRRLCRHFGLKEVEVGLAGRKDARGITSQRVSVPARKVEGREHEVSSLGDVELLGAKRHGNKLRLGHLAGNRFTVRVMGDVDVALLAARADAAAQRGVANYFGAQRFGPDDASLREAERFLRHGRAPRSRKEEFLVSVFQAALFNAWLDGRVRAGLFTQPLEGDVMWKAGNHAPFTCTEPSVDGERMSRQEILLTGPLFGSQMRRPGSEALTFESRCLEAAGVSETELLAHPALQVGARRASRLLPEDMRTALVEGGVEFSFLLPSGCYATVLLREICGPRWIDAASDDPRGDPFVA